MSNQLTFADEVQDVLRVLKVMLLEKNRKYGDAALNPKRILSRASAVEQIKVRIDDKLSRLANEQADEDEDVVWDLLGYLVLLRIAQNRIAKENPATM
jgi:hypothetical protein